MSGEKRKLDEDTLHNRDEGADNVGKFTGKKLNNTLPAAVHYGNVFISTMCPMTIQEDLRRNIDATRFQFVTEERNYAGEVLLGKDHFLVDCWPAFCPLSLIHQLRHAWPGHVCTNQWKRPDLVNPDHLPRPAVSRPTTPKVARRRAAGATVHSESEKMKSAAGQDPFNLDPSVVALAVSPIKGAKTRTATRSAKAVKPKPKPKLSHRFIPTHIKDKNTPSMSATRSPTENMYSEQPKEKEEEKKNTSTNDQKEDGHKE